MSEAFKQMNRTTEAITEYIPMIDLKDGWVYFVSARNIDIAVWSEKEHQFYGIRSKFGDRFIDGEFHWEFTDDGKEIGSVKPLVELFECPVRTDDEAALSQYLKGIEERLQAEGLK